MEDPLVTATVRVMVLEDPVVVIAAVVSVVKDPVVSFGSGVRGKGFSWR